MFLGSGARPARRADNLWADCPDNVRLTTLQACLATAARRVVVPWPATLEPCRLASGDIRYDRRSLGQTELV
jgi:hypothetical protein